MKKESIGRLLLSLLTAFVMVVGVFGAAVYTDSQTWESANSPVHEIVVADEDEDRMSGIGDAPISADFNIADNSARDGITLFSQLGDRTTSGLSKPEEAIEVWDPIQPERQDEDETYESEDSSSIQGTRAPGDVVEAYGPYGEMPPGTPYYEGAPVSFDADIVGAGSNADYKFRWDVTGDDVFDGPGTAPDYYGDWGETEYTHTFLDNSIGTVIVDAWDGVSTGPLGPWGNMLGEPYYMGSYWLPVPRFYQNPPPNNNDGTWGLEFAVYKDCQVDQIGFFKTYAPSSFYNVKIWEKDTATLLGVRNYPSPLPYYAWGWFTFKDPADPFGPDITLQLDAGKNYVVSAHMYYSDGRFPYYTNPGPTSDGVMEPLTSWFNTGGDSFPCVYERSGNIVMMDVNYQQIGPLGLQDEADIFVDNVAPIGINPQCTLLPGEMGQEGSDVGFTASLIDPGTDDDWEYRWDFGDGTYSPWRSVNKWEGGARILIAQSYYANELTDTQNYLYDILGPFATQIDIWNPGPAGLNQIPALDDLLPYDVVISAENVIMTPAQEAALGDVLADYSDAGGNVVTTWVSDSDDSFYGEIGITGRWRDEVYNVFIPDDLDFASYTLGTVYDPGHPIMQGVNSISTYLSTWAPDVEADATRLADDSYGEPIIGYKDNPKGSGGRIVGINLITHGAYTTGDYDQLLANAVKWASQQPDPAPLPMPIPLDVVYHTYKDDHPTSVTPFDSITACVEIRDDDHGKYALLGDVTTILDEDFSGGVPPAGWTIDTTNWQASAGNLAGGTAPECRFYWIPYGYTAVSRLKSPGIDTTGFTTIDLSWKQYLSHYGGPYTLSVETSADGVNWDTIWEVVNPTGFSAHTVSVTTGQNIGGTTYFAWTFSNGDPYNLNNWNIDDLYSVILPELYYMDGLSIPVCTVATIENVFPSVNVPSYLQGLQVQENIDVLVSGIKLTDAAWGVETEDWMWRWVAEDGTPETSWDFLYAAYDSYEDYEQDPALWPWAPWVHTAPPGFESVHAGAAHDGQYGLEIDQGSTLMWLYRTDISVGNAGDTYNFWLRIPGYGPSMTDSGRAYMSFGATSSGSYTFQIEPNTNSISIVDCDPYGTFTSLATTPYTFTHSDWYYCEIEFVTATHVIGHLFDTDGTTELATVEYDSLPSGVLPGGIGFRCFDYGLTPRHFYIDTMGSGVPKSPIIPDRLKSFGDNGIYTDDLQIIDDDMLWDITGSQPVFTGTPGTEDQWISHNYITVEVLDTEPTISPIRARAEVDIILEIKHGDRHGSSADVTLYENGVQIAQETSYGKEKCGGIEMMELMYSGPPGVITAYKADVTDLGGGLYLITPTGSYTKLKSNTKLYVDGVQVAEIHTSCSKPIEIGHVHGDFTIVDLVKIMKTGPPAIIPATIEIGQGDEYEIVVEWNQGTKKDEKAYLWLRYADGKSKKLRQKLTPSNPIWTIPHQSFMSKILDTPIIFTASASDPGSDDLAFIWNWGDETPTGVHLYDNDDQTTAVVGRIDAGPVIFDQLPGRDPWFDRPANDQRSPDMNPMSVDDTMLHSFKGKHKYSKCKGVSKMVLEYTGGEGADITANEAVVTDNGDGTYTFTPTGDKLKASTKISVDGKEEADIHTSCSKPIDVGMVFGDFTIVGLDKIGAGTENFFEVMLKVVDDDIGDGYTSYQNFNNDGGYDMESISIDLR